MDWMSMREQADQVQIGSNHLEQFHQHRTSGRQHSRWENIGLFGSITFLNVPLFALPWLQWAGRLGVGDSRNCGAGLWHMELA
jgi:hypothetical protein